MSGQGRGGQLGVRAAAYRAPSACTTITDQPVGDHVVHLAGDPRPLVRRRQRHLLGGLPLDPLAALDQGVDVRPPGPAQGAERPGGDHDAGHGQEVRRERVAVSSRRTPPASRPTRPPPPTRATARRDRGRDGGREARPPSRARSGTPPGCAAGRRSAAPGRRWRPATAREHGDRVAAPPQQRHQLGRGQHQPASSRPRRAGRPGPAASARRRARRRASAGPAAAAATAGGAWGAVLHGVTVDRRDGRRQPTG